MILEIVSALVLFVRLKLAELVEPIPTEPKLLLLGLRLTEELPEPAPTPVSVAVCGLFEELSVTVNVPFSVPDEGGVNVTVIVHVPFAASVFGEIGQFDVCE